MRQVTLEEIAYGAPFKMLSYGDRIFVRVRTHNDVTIERPFCPAKSSKFNDDGYHVPIVEIATGWVVWMAKVKPCFIEPSHCDFIAG